MFENCVGNAFSNVLSYSGIIHYHFHSYCIPNPFTAVCDNEKPSAMLLTYAALQILAVLSIAVFYKKCQVQVLVCIGLTEVAVWLRCKR